MKKELNNLIWDCKTSSAQGYSQREPEMVDSFRGNFFLYFHICQEEVRGVVEEEIRKRKEKRKGKRSWKTYLLCVWRSHFLCKILCPQHLPFLVEALKNTEQLLKSFQHLLRRCLFKSYLIHSLLSCITKCILAFPAHVRAAWRECGH